MTALNNASCITQDTIHDVISDCAQSWPESASELEEEELEEDREQLEEDTHTSRPGCHTASPYSLTSGPLSRHTRSRSTIYGRSNRCGSSIASSSCRSGRSCRSYLHPVASSSIDSHPPSPSSPAGSAYVWEEAALQPSSALINPRIHPSDHIKTLLSQLGSSVSASKTAFSLLRASSSPHTSAEDAYNRAVMAMTEELQTLSHLHLRLYSLVQQHTFGDSSSETSSSETNDVMGPNIVERQEAMLTSYEGVITRFHDEIVRKEAVAEALKETLAKSMLKGEKLERRTKALEAKLSAPVHVK
ncbi:hypothetical protein L7F22_041226 [Adiantum nelumboides]|nr:hypothetical protein [Adiantum nelumboides]